MWQRGQTSVMWRSISSLRRVLRQAERPSVMPNYSATTCQRRPLMPTRRRRRTRPNPGAAVPPQNPPPAPPQRRRRRRRRQNQASGPSRLEEVNALILEPQVTLSSGVWKEKAWQIRFSLAGLKAAGQTRLVQIMDCYDRYRFRNFRLEWTSTMSTHSTGALGMYWDPGTSDHAPATFQELSGNYGAKTSQIYHNLSLGIQTWQLDRMKWYLTHASGSSGEQGILFVAVSPGSIPALTGTLSLGYLWLRGTLELSNPSRPTLTPSLSSTALSTVPVPSVVQLEKQIAGDPEGSQYPSTSWTKRAYDNLVQSRRQVDALAATVAATAGVSALRVIDAPTAAIMELNAASADMRLPLTERIRAFEAEADSLREAIAQMLAATALSNHDQVVYQSRVNDIAMDQPLIQQMVPGDLDVDQESDSE
uniref:Capsid protein n=1 Tax=Riboviria sp. TaxID=2585031 RepID=A0A8K1WRK9_9VIRU|nr:MAG: hypothetical protein 1 [Riboviria sp.]